MNRRAALRGSLAAGAALALPGEPVRANAPLSLDDASRLNATPVARHVVVRSAGEPALLETLRRELKDAAAAGRPVAVGTARHSMGGQSLARLGTNFTFDMPQIAPDVRAGTYRAAAGARWRDVVAALDPLGFSPAVLQSNNDFGAAATFSVNAHGWPVPFGPMGSTVRSIRLMLADGTVVRCSRTENAALFGLAMGGYGLLGIILDLEVAMVPNLLLKPAFEPLAADAFGTRLATLCAEPGVAMAYGRLDVSRGRFLRDALLVSYRALPAPRGGLPAASAPGGLSGFLTHEVYRAEVGSDWGKRLRWFMETEVGTRLGGGVTRNTLLNDPVSALAETGRHRTDILNEYFVPPEAFPAFLAACRELVPKHRQDLLNVTLRWVAADRESVLAYAPTPRIAAVMSFSIPRTPEADTRLQAMTQELIDRVIAIGGSFYLPYRLHARPDQLARTYPAIATFAAAKRQFDPGLLFRNALWDKWLAPL